MATKRQRLTARARASTRRPDVARLAPANGGRPGYRVVGVSLYTPQVEFLERIARELAAGGYHKANKSLVVQGALAYLEAQLAALQVTTPGDVAEFFREQAERCRREGGARWP